MTNDYKQRKGRPAEPVDSYSKEKTSQID